MKNRFVYYLLLWVLAGCFYCSDVNGKKNEQQLTYDIHCGGSANQGYYLVEVTTYAKKSSHITSSLIARCAVHGVLFKGFTGAPGCTSQRPLAGSVLVEQQHADFFTTFFQEGGGYSSYASVVAGSMKTVKEQKMFKVTALVSVAKDQLRQDLEKAGIIKGLNTGF